ncbi:hypothetical protein Pmar_PMAR028909 [Perkinsus marinus ATCC 50983]|uniref:Uncharacterized protein n=1 Tax=Perkinsus marinus (strain ATCC 50983 / TXsc) TaxID=423536 RepID=C5LRS3_PERM5|nr:hypothetical protein Pmar_PMAR028909 [Perkinsus marinus ATCC 50983]EER00579.1 hypothetical protein Pmar_PMAR028909 [Perkinsus marinus ATCC 50983]|eukprot:XP_002767861.1 hypothetical protein Pmar_PMAR028909 [Perkinsus marinus ATCC 50983]
MRPRRCKVLNLGIRGMDSTRRSGSQRRLRTRRECLFLFIKASSDFIVDSAFNVPLRCIELSLGLQMRSNLVRPENIVEMLIARSAEPIRLALNFKKSSETRVNRSKPSIRHSASVVLST